MRNGLTLTVPSGWEGVLKSSADGSATYMGVLGRSGATESMKLRRTDGTGDLMRISVSSARVSEATRGGLTLVGEVGNVTLYRTGDTASNVPVLLIAETHRADFEYGAVLFRGDAGDAEALVREVWRLLSIEGAPLVGKSTVAML